MLQSLNVCFGNISNLVGNFVGQEHFQCLVRLLGYQGIAVVLEELIGKSQNLVSFSSSPSSAVGLTGWGALEIAGQLTQLVRSVQGAMPKVCKLPRPDYGSPGVLTFYQAQLKDVLAHDAVRSELFQVRELRLSCLLSCRLLGNRRSGSWGTRWSSRG